MSKYKKKTASNHNDASKDSLFGVILRFALRIALFFALHCLISLLSSAIFYNFENPTFYISICSTISSILSGLVSGILVSRLEKNRVLIRTIISAVMLLLILMSIGMIFNNGEISILNYLIAPCSFLFGALIGKRRSKGNKRHKRHSLRHSIN